MITVKEIASLINGEVFGDGDVLINNMASPEFALEGAITFALDNDGLEKSASSKAACVVTQIETAEFSKPVIKVDNLKIALTMLYNLLNEKRLVGEGDINTSAHVDPSAKIGKGVVIGPHACISENAQIGDGTTIGANAVVGKEVKIGKMTRILPNCTIYDRAIVGDFVILHSGVVIGSDGFGYLPHGGRIFKVPQLGRVVIEDEVEIGANSCVDRGTFGDTVIGKGTKIDNLVQIAHNVQIGKYCFFAALNGIAGSAQIGDHVMAGGQIGVKDHIKIGNNVKIAAKSGVIKDLEDNSVVFGYPAKESRSVLREFAFMTWLTKNAAKIRNMVKKASEEEYSKGAK